MAKVDSKLVITADYKAFVYFMRNDRLHGVSLLEVYDDDTYKYFKALDLTPTPTIIAGIRPHVWRVE